MAASRSCGPPPTGRALSGSASLPSLRDRLRCPSAHWCGSRTATVTPGPRSTASRSCRIADWFAVWTRVGFCSSRPPFDCGGAGSAKDWSIGGRCAASASGRFLPLLSRLLPLAGKEKQGMALGGATEPSSAGWTLRAGHARDMLSGSRAGRHRTCAEAIQPACDAMRECLTRIALEHPGERPRPAYT
jgi:hypothetical protein